MRVTRFVSILLLFVLILTGIGHGKRASSTILTGKITDSETGELLSRVTIKVENRQITTLCNDDGLYRVRLPLGKHRVRFTHVSHHTVWIEVEARDSVQVMNLEMNPAVHELGTIKVYDRKYDAAQRIIVEAIRRKKEILSQIEDYQYDGYSRFVLRDRSKPDSSNILLLTEVRSTAYWEQPGKFKEIIHARKQSANLNPEDFILAVGEFLNFNKNRIKLDDYSIPTPTATDALEHYNYYLIDTVLRGDRRVFRLELEPKNPQQARFTGFIQIADSTYDVVAVDMGLSEGASFPLVSDIGYSQRFELFEQKYWMPVEIRFTGEVDLGVPFPGVPKVMGFSNVAMLYNFKFEKGHEAGRFDEFVFEVEEDADDLDSSAWSALPSIPLTFQEKDAYRRIDSLENVPKPLGKKLLRTALVLPFLVAGGADDLFRYNRVEGAYAGLGMDFEKVIPRTSIELKSGYAFGIERWEHQYGVKILLKKKNRLNLHLEYRNKIVRRETLVSSANQSMTFAALAFRFDPFDYYSEKGWSADVSGRIVNHLNFNVGFDDFNQFSAPVSTDYSFFEIDRPVRTNPIITDGKLRAIRGSLAFDSRKLMMMKKKVLPVNSSEYWYIKTGVQYASPEFVSNDFDYRRYFVWLMRRQRLFSIGISSLYLFAGATDGQAPPQRYFTVDYGNAITFESDGFPTLDQNNFYGVRAAYVRLNHDFDNLFFARSSLPILSSLPFKSSIHGGLFWTELNKNSSFNGDSELRQAPTAYSELGFGIANLTPFLGPFNFAAYFTWQFSDYATDRFQFDIGIKL